MRITTPSVTKGNADVSHDWRARSTSLASFTTREYFFVRLNPALASWLNLSGIFAGPSGHAQIKIPNEFSAEALSWRINIPATFERAFIPPIRCWICPSRCRKISPCNTALASAPCVDCGIEGIRRIFGVQSSPCSPLPRLIALASLPF
ncbi:Uncharacterised protein [Salmonella enterica subsp. enterica serovar Bovismorbificans]|uniref:Uncharacterized protein n=1 Tax=Salmonella enterica subsp. enterica serovar Bovismorbificans TaxID=58097 RepID=A0A655C6X6_SALET|nr:Uncharacterised protein [Salmonella enterica subsp. enterica serovar Bovismorbificans]CNU69836.1 Uncharacterised protein [Salmonella enterica subsp. enterica serovar Bovismorbificans]